MPTPRLVVSRAGGDFTSISDALRAAPAGAEILVRFGFYEEQLTVDKPVVIRGEGAPEQTVVKKSGFPAVLAKAQVVLIGLTLAADLDEDWAVVDVEGPADVTLQRCTISGSASVGVNVYKAGAVAV